MIFFLRRRGFVAELPLLDEFMTLARLALTGRGQDVSAYLQKTARRYKSSVPVMTERLMGLLREAPNQTSPLRGQAGLAAPVDFDSRQQLVRVEQPGQLEIEPILPAELRKSLQQIISEHEKTAELAAAGLNPSRAVLFYGPPGVGKTLSGRWIASKLNKPLLVLDLSAVMSSYLGRTGGNVRAVLDYAKSENCILFLDEIDAVAKRRDDAGEVGELKRLVTVILQEIDDWPSGSLLLAATNHPDLLDPAIWRRFDASIEFPTPGEPEIREAIGAFLGTDLPHDKKWVSLLSILFRNQNLNDVERAVLRARRQKVINGSEIEHELQQVVKGHSDGLSLKDRLSLGEAMQSLSTISENRIHELTGISRVTLQKRRIAKISPKRARRKADGG
jgi:SpoVK/Ycf46/Vps4 family AAA+-type ATPase